MALRLELGAIEGTGPDGSITLADVEARGPGERRARARRTGTSAGFDPAEMRKAIAAAMARSKREIPHYYLDHRPSIAPGVRLAQRANRERPPTERLLPAALLLKATALALARCRS